jgi:hypothetical protein
MRPLYWLFASAALGLSGCATLDYEGCASHRLAWTFGPTGDASYIDVCYVELNSEEIDKHYVLVPIIGATPDTGQPIDSNADGISGNGRRVQGNKIRWGGNDCKQYVRRITQKGCMETGNQNRTAGCDWIAIHLQAKPKKDGTSLELTPVWRVRLPNGRIEDWNGKTLRTGYGSCG